jgi:hypothetical protein
MADKTSITTIYVALANEGTSVWRPVQAVPIGDNVFRIAPTEVPDGEEWEFAPGSIVRCERRSLSSGPALVAIELVRSAI